MAQTGYPVQKEILLSKAHLACDCNKIAGKLDFTMGCYLALMQSLSHNKTAHHISGHLSLSRWVK